MFSLRQLIVKPICLAVGASLCLFLPTLGMAGQSPVNPIDDSSSGGTVYFNPPPSGLCAGVCVELVSSGGTATVEIAPGVTATAMCTSTACSSSVLGLDQITGGIGSGGSAVTLEQHSADLVAEAGYLDEATVGGQVLSPIGALSMLATTPAIDELSVEMPCGVTVPAASILTNVATALNSKDATLMGTTLNDAAIAMRLLLADGTKEVSEELLAAARTIAELLLSARDQ